MRICKANSRNFFPRETLWQTFNHMESIPKPSTPVFRAINVGPSANIKATSSLSPLPWRLRRRPELRRERRRLTPPPYTHMPVIQIRPLLKREREASSHFFTALTSVQKNNFFECVAITLYYCIGGESIGTKTAACVFTSFWQFTIILQAQTRIPILDHRSRLFSPDPMGR